MSDIGVKIQARNEYFINLTVPTRDEVRKNNYIRRRTQLSSEGFYSKIWKPYVCIGHALDLDKAAEFSVSPDNDKCLEIKNDTKILNKTIEAVTDSNKITQNLQNIKKRSERLEQLNENIKEELKKSQMVNFSVRRGHSFFDILQKEQDHKRATAEEAVKLQKLKETTEIRPPALESDSESELEYQSTELVTPMSRPSTGISRKRPNSRPFTPQYNNISHLTNRPSTQVLPSSLEAIKESGGNCRPSTTIPENIRTPSYRPLTSNSDDVKQTSLYRQLCSLHWLLEAMVHENVENMPRISLSWTIRKEDNTLTSLKNRKEIKANWEKFIFKQDKQDQNPRSLKTRVVVSIPNSFRSTHSANMSQLSKIKEKDQEHDNTNNFQHLQRTHKLSDSKSSISTVSNATTRPCFSAVEMKKSTMVSRVKSVCEELDKTSNDYEYRRNLHLMRIGRLSKDNEIKIESVKLLPQNRYSEKLQEKMMRHHDQSYQIVDERMSNLQENIRNMTEYKINICVNKYKDIQTKGAFHHMLRTFRGKNTYQSYFSALDRSRNKVVYTDWFLSLVEYLKEYENNKQIVRALEKIRPYALNTNTKLNSKRLLSALKYLSGWEIRHPDVCASITFITDHIVSMTENEYQVWFTQNFK